MARLAGTRGNSGNRAVNPRCNYKRRKSRSLRLWSTLSCTLWPALWQAYVCAPAWMAMMHASRFYSRKKKGGASPIADLISSARKRRSLDKTSSMSQICQLIQLSSLFFISKLLSWYNDACGIENWISPKLHRVQFNRVTNKVSPRSLQSGGVVSDLVWPSRNVTT